ncbi:Receptor-like tyrosine-protein kinase kin-15, partial [Dissostichus eleginoides]
MAQELELSEYDTIQYDLQGNEKDSSAYEPAVLCILQATLNLSLGLAFYSKEDTDQIPFNSSMIADVCQINQTQLHSKNKLYSCYKKLLGELLKENQAHTSSDEEDQALSRLRPTRVSRNHELQGGRSLDLIENERKRLCSSGAKDPRKLITPMASTPPSSAPADILLAFIECFDCLRVLAAVFVQVPQGLIRGNGRASHNLSTRSLVPLTTAGREKGER